MSLAAGILVMPASGKHKKWVSGHIVSVRLSDGTYGYGQLSEFPLIRFFGLNTETFADPSLLLDSEEIFAIPVMRSALKDVDWHIIGSLPDQGVAAHHYRFFRKDALSGEVDVVDFRAIKAPIGESKIDDLECMAVWSACHVQDRLLDHFQGRPNKWVLSMRP